MKSLPRYPDEQIKLARFRELFPITEDTVYMNHAGTGPMSLRAEKAIKECIEIYKSQAEFAINDYFGRLRESRKIYAKLINAEPEEIAFTHNTSEGIYTALINLPLKERDEIIIMSEVFPAVHYVVKYNLPGIVKRFVSFSGKDPIQVVKQVLSKRTRAVVVDHVQFFSGEMIELKRLSQYLRNNGVFLIVDGIQSAGAIALDMKELNIDFFASGGGKWLFGPGGTGFLYINRKNFRNLRRLHTGWLGVDWKNFENFEVTPPLFDDARMFEQGTRNMIGISGLTEHIRMLLDFGIENVHARVLKLKEQLRDGFEELRFPVVTPRCGPQSGIITIKPHDARKVCEYLTKNRVTISLRNNCLRFSPHFYNTEKEVNQVLKLLRKFCG